MPRKKNNQNKDVDIQLQQKRFVKAILQAHFDDLGSNHCVYFGNADDKYLYWEEDETEALRSTITSVDETPIAAEKEAWEHEIAEYEIQHKLLEQKEIESFVQQKELAWKQRKAQLEARDRKQKLTAKKEEEIALIVDALFDRFWITFHSTKGYVDRVKQREQNE